MKDTKQIIRQLIQEVLEEIDAVNNTVGDAWDEAWDNGDGTFDLVIFTDDSFEGKRPSKRKTVKPNDPNLTSQEKDLIEKSKQNSKQISRSSKKIDSLNKWLSKDGGLNAVRLIKAFDSSKEKLQDVNFLEKIVVYLKNKIDNEDSASIDLRDTRVHEKYLIPAIVKLISVKNPSAAEKILNFFGLTFEKK